MWPPAAADEMAGLMARPWPSRAMRPPRLVPSTENCTVPVGAVASAAVTVAVKVTGWP